MIRLDCVQCTAATAVMPFHNGFNNVARRELVPSDMALPSWSSLFTATHGEGSIEAGLSCLGDGMANLKKYHGHLLGFFVHVSMLLHWPWSHCRERQDSKMFISCPVALTGSTQTILGLGSPQPHPAIIDHGTGSTGWPRIWHVKCRAASWPAPSSVG